MAGWFVAVIVYRMYASLFCNVWYISDMQPVLYHIVFQFPQENVTLPEGASDDDIYQLARTFYIRAENLTDVALVHVGVVHSGNLSNVTATLLM